MDPVMIGVLLDVSESMSRSTDTGDTEWARSIFTVIDNLIKHDLRPNNHIFAIGFGAGREVDPCVFDLLGTLKAIREMQDSRQESCSRHSLWYFVDSILDILETNGASNVRKWAPMDILMRALNGKESECDLILKELQRDGNFVRYAVDSCLPSACRDYKGDGLFTGFKNWTYEGVSSVATNFVTATEEDVNKVEKNMKTWIEKSKNQQPVLESVSKKSLFEAREAYRILRGHVNNENDLTKKRIDEMMDNIKPYIYGGTPLYQALGRSAEMFSQSDFKNHKKLLFLLSDGQPTDGLGGLLTVNHADITTVSCFITPSDIDPFILHSSATDTQEWEPAAKFMFQLSSTMLTQNVPRTIFVKRQWKVEMKSNETKLFLQVNHPDHLKDACDFGREVVTSQEALSEVLASVDLDIYINQSNDDFKAQDQGEEFTCYAHASATVMHLAMNRILGRDGGVPEFASLRDEMTNCYRKQPGGEQGADTRIVLNEMCPRYRLRCEQVDKSRAMRAIMEKRPVVARFRLTKREWNNFGSFFRRNETGILTSDVIKMDRRKQNEKTFGHAVVLISFNSKCLRFMNSWGTGFADGGFFNVQDADVLDFEFFDVYWNEDDLTSDEKAYHNTHGSKVAEKLMKNLTGLQESTFECPLCKITSKVTEFKGRLSNVTCPKCGRAFKCNTKGNVLALNLYLTSISCVDTTKAANRPSGGTDVTEKANECKPS